MHDWIAVPVFECGDLWLASGQVEAVSTHDLGPGGHEVPDELILVIVLGVDLGVAAQHRVGAEHQIRPGRGPLDLVGLAVADLVQVVAWAENASRLADATPNAARAGRVAIKFIVILLSSWTVSYRYPDTGTAHEAMRKMLNWE